MTTQFEQIAAAFPLHCQRIAEATFEQNRETFARLMAQTSAGRSPGFILCLLFDWEKTVEGDAYWCALSRGQER